MKINLESNKSYSSHFFSSLATVGHCKDSNEWDYLVGQRIAATAAGGWDGRRRQRRLDDAVATLAGGQGGSQADQIGPAAADLPAGVAVLVGVGPPHPQQRRRRLNYYGKY